MRNIFSESGQELVSYRADTKSVHATFNLSLNFCPWSSESETFPLHNIHFLWGARVRVRDIFKSNKVTIFCTCYLWPPITTWTLKVSVHNFCFKIVCGFIEKDMSMKYFKNRTRGSERYGENIHYVQLTFDLFLWPWTWIRVSETFALHAVSLRLTCIEVGCLQPLLLHAFSSRKMCMCVCVCNYLRSRLYFKI